jgi:molybdopterin-guanine dinucleotide biosynthesis protein A
MEWDAVIVAGGPATRLGGIEKCELRLGGRTLLQIALAATDRAESRVVVGRLRDDLPAGCSCVLEEPRFAGVLAALETGLAALPPDGPEIVAVVAADQPSAEDALPVVLSEVAPRSPYDGWVATDPTRVPHPLLASYRKAALQHALQHLREEGVLAGADMHGLVAGLALKPVRLFGFLCADVDEPSDVLELELDAEGVGVAR